MSKIGSELVQVIKDKEFKGITKDLVEMDNSINFLKFKQILLVCRR